MAWAAYHGITPPLNAAPTVVTLRTSARVCATSSDTSRPPTVRDVSTEARSPAGGSPSASDCGAGVSRSLDGAEDSPLGPPGPPAGGVADGGGVAVVAGVAAGVEVGVAVAVGVGVGVVAGVGVGDGVAEGVAAGGVAAGGVAVGVACDGVAAGVGVGVGVLGGAAMVTGADSHVSSPSLSATQNVTV